MGLQYSNSTERALCLSSESAPPPADEGGALGPKPVVFGAAAAKEVQSKEVGFGEQNKDMIVEDMDDDDDEAGVGIDD